MGPEAGSARQHGVWDNCESTHSNTQARVWMVVWTALHCTRAQRGAWYCAWTPIGEKFRNDGRTFMTMTGGVLRGVEPRTVSARACWLASLLLLLKSTRASSVCLHTHTFHIHPHVTRGVVHFVHTQGPIGMGTVRVRNAFLCVRMRTRCRAQEQRKRM
jgi:hypothetical protein